MAIIGSERGIDIACDERGVFSAIVGERRFENRSLAKVRKAIQTAAPVIYAYGLVTAHDSVRLTPFMVRDVFRDGGGKVVLQGVHSWESVTQPFVCDEKAKTAVESLSQEYYARKKQLSDWYSAQVKALVDTLEPLTPERYQEMLQEAFAKQGVSDE